MESLSDTSSSSAETILTWIPLQSRIGQFVKVEFSLTAKWLLLSEITFYTGKEFISLYYAYFEQRISNE